MSRKILLSILVAGLSLVCGSLLSSDTYAVNGWANIRNFRLNSSGLSSSNPTDHVWFYPVSYTPTITSGYARLFNPVLTIDGNVTSLPSGHDFRIYFIGNATSKAASNIGYSPFETDVLAVYSGNFICFDDDISISNNNGGAFNSTTNLYEYNFSFVHKLSCRTTGDFTVNDLHIAGMLLKYNVVYANSNVEFKLDLQGKIVWYDDPTYDVLSDIDNNISSLNSGISDIASDTDSINRNLQSLKDAQDQANDDANDRYQDEKDNIDNNVNGGVDSVDNIDKTINLPSPLAFLLGTLSSSNCYDISTLAGMVNSSDTQYCSWFSSDTRNIMTPFVDVFVFFIGTMFIWSWVKKGGL